MKIKLIDISNMESIGLAGVMPYQTKVKDNEKLAYRVWKAGHRSITRHSIVTFEVEGISQDALRQLSRHPHINLTVKSTRYCDFNDTTPFIPAWVDVEGLKDEFVKDFHEIIDKYSKWQSIEKAYYEEDTSKLFLPLASRTNLVMSGNIQAIYEFLILRNCVRASEEIRNMSQAMTKILGEQNGLIGMIFYELDCKGEEFGFCPEHKTCGKYPNKGE